MNYYIIAGEASGDMHGANLVAELKKRQPTAQFRGWGGDKMKTEGVEITKHYKELAFMGFAEVLLNIRTILGNFKVCKKEVLDYQPDAVILIDYPGFNLRMAEFIHSQQLTVFYYISPTVWAWKKNRVEKIKKYVDRLFVILPFEKPFYQECGYEVDFVGNPLLDEISKFKATYVSEDFRQKHSLSNKPIIALLPGSRTQEIRTKLPVMLSVIDHFPDYQFVIGGAPSQEREVYQQFIEGRESVSIVFGETYPLLMNSHAGLITSGTATLETALFKVPQVVCYKANPISYRIAKMLVKIKYISLVNLIMDKEVVTELIQHDLTEKRVSTELGNIIEGEKRQSILADYSQLIEQLGVGGASSNTAEGIVSFMKSKK
jgi:lipid-A-disaccharide synthase